MQTGFTVECILIPFFPSAFALYMLVAELYGYGWIGRKVIYISYREIEWHSTIVNKMPNAPIKFYFYKPVVITIIIYIYIACRTQQFTDCSGMSPCTCRIYTPLTPLLIPSLDNFCRLLYMFSLIDVRGDGRIKQCCPPYP